MFYYFIVMLLIISVIYIYKRQYRSNHFYLNAKQRQVKTIFKELYENTCGEQLSKQDRGSFIKDDCSLIYGEVYFDSFVAILAAAEPKARDIFCDLGSGTGKAVIAAALLHNFAMCIGIEILPALYQTSLEKLVMLQKIKTNHLSNIQFIQTDFYKFDFSNANIVFINATGFFGESYRDLVLILKKLNPGTRIIITSKLLPLSDFELTHQAFYLMSWGLSRVSIYLR